MGIVAAAVTKVFVSMFFQILFIHLFRPFLKYNEATSPLPSTVSPRKLCTHAATTISKLLRLYKRSHGLRQICNICVYIAHTACTIHLLNLPSKDARRDIIHGVKHLEEIAEGWLCARRTLGILSTLGRQWKVELPEEAAAVLKRTDAKFGAYNMNTAPAVKQEQSQVSEVMPVDSKTAEDYRNQPQRSQQNVLASPVTESSVYPPSTPYMPNPAIHSIMQQSGHNHLSFANNAASYGYSPTSASDFGRGSHASDYSSPATNTPHHAHSSIHYNPEGHTARTMGLSPSDMFGGVEQLLRENADWVFEDQAQLASGFENWASSASNNANMMMDDFKPGLHIANSGGSGNLIGQMSNNTNASFSNMNGMNGMNGMSGHVNGNGNGNHANMNMYAFPGITSYDEEEWYR